MLFSGLNIHTPDGRLRGIPAADPAVLPVGAVVNRGIAMDPVNQAVYYSGAATAGPPLVDESFPYADGELEGVSGGEWIRTGTVSTGFNVEANRLTGANRGDTFYKHASFADYENKAQYIELTYDLFADWQALAVNATFVGTTAQAYGIKTNTTGVLEWCYINGGITSTGNSGVSAVAGDRIGVFYDPAVPGQIKLYKNDSLVGTHTFAAPADAYPQGGVPIFGGFSGVPGNVYVTHVGMSGAAPGVAQIPALEPTLDPVNDVFIEGLRVSSVGILYITAGPGTQIAPNGILTDDDGVAVFANETPQVFLAGVGLLSNGTLCGFNATGVPPTPFSSGFSNGFGL